MRLGWADKNVATYHLCLKHENVYDFLIFHHGVPQRRNRIIFIGYRRGLIPPEYPAPTVKPENYLTLQDAIGDLIVDDNVREGVCKELTPYQLASINGTFCISTSPLTMKERRLMSETYCPLRVAYLP